VQQIVMQRIVSWGRSRDGSGFARGNRSVDTEGFCKSQMTLNSGLRRQRATLGRFRWNGRNSVPGCPRGHPEATLRPPSGPPSGHPQATLRPPSGHPQATLRPPSGHPQATLRPYGSQPVGTLRPPSGYPEATLRLPGGSGAGREEPGAGGPP
jgi:hypothetical protein